MHDDDATKITAVLHELRDGQKLQLERQLEALELQRQQFAILQDKNSRVERIQDKAELLQERGAKFAQVARKVFVAMVLVIFALIAYVSWLIFTLRH